MNKVIIAFTLFICIACTRSPSVHHELMQADSLMQSYPDSALQLLENIHPQLLAEKENSAYYALLLTQAKDKNFIKQTSDSLIHIAIAYYDSTKNVPMQAKAHYLKGAVHRDANNYRDAIVEYLTAISLAQKSKENSLLLRIYHNIGYIYYTQDLNEQADSIYRLAEHLSLALNDSLSWAESLSWQGANNIERGKAFYHEAEKQLLQAYELAVPFKKRQMAINLTSFLSSLYSRMNNAPKALDFAKQLLSYQNDTSNCHRAYLLLGDAYYKVSQYDSASVYLQKSISSEGFYVKAGSYMRLADIAKEEGDFKKSTEMERLYSAYMDSAQHKKQAVDIVKNENKIQLSQQQTKHDRTLNQHRYFILSFAAVSIILFIYLSNRFKRKKVQLQHETKDYNHNTQKAINLQQELHSLKSQRASLLEETYVYSQIHAKMERIIQAYKKLDASTESFDSDDWRVFVLETDKRWNDITIRMKQDYHLSQEDIHICCLYLTEFPTDHLKYIIGCSRDTIYKKTYAVLDKMGQPHNTRKLKEILRKYREATP